MACTSLGWLGGCPGGCQEIAFADLREQRHATLIALTAVLAVAAGLIGLSVIGYWYAADMGWTGSGSTIVESRAPIIAAALVPAASVLFGVIALLVKDDLPTRSFRGGALVAANLVIAASVWLGVNAYPQVRPATLIGLDQDSTVGWRAELPVTEVFGLRDETATTVTVEGRADRRGCDAQLRSVTVERSTGDVVAVETLPRAYEDLSQVPPPPGPLAAGPGGFDVEQGSTHFICRN